MRKRHAIAALALLLAVPAAAQKAERYYEYGQYGMIGRGEGWARRFAHSLFDSFLGAEYYVVEEDGGDGTRSFQVIDDEDGTEMSWSYGGDNVCVRKTYHFGPGHTPYGYWGLNILCGNRPPEASADLPQRVGKGFEFGFALGQYGYHVTPNFGFNTALYLTRSRYWLERGSYLAWQDNGSGEVLTLVGPGNGVSQGWLRYWSLRVPFCMEFSAGSHNGVFLAFGPEIEYRFADVSKVRYTGGSKEKLTKDTGINPLGLNATVRLGIDDFGIIARYSFNELFNASSPVSTFPFMIGLSASF